MQAPEVTAVVFPAGGWLDIATLGSPAFPCISSICYLWRVRGTGGTNVFQVSCHSFLPKADYFSSVATVVYLRKENCMYQACPTQDCNKKVIDQQNGLYRCEKCDSEFPNFKYRMILSVSRMGRWEVLWSSSPYQMPRSCRDNSKSKIACGRKPADA